MTRQEFTRKANSIAAARGWTVDIVQDEHAIEAYFMDGDCRDVAQAYMAAGAQPVGLHELAEPKAAEPVKCAGCGEYWPCSDSTRRDIRPELRASHYPQQPKADEDEAQVYLILSNEAGRWIATERCDADGERFALSVLDVGGLVSAYRATPQQINALMSAAWSRRVHPTHLVNSFGLEELELGNVIG